MGVENTINFKQLIFHSIVMMMMMIQITIPFTEHLLVPDSCSSNINSLNTY